jgi:general secretion pathway protein D
MRFPILVLLTASLTALAGCAAPVRDDVPDDGIGMEVEPADVLVETTETTTTTTEAPISVTPAEVPPADAPASRRKVEPGTAVFIDEDAARRRADGPVAGDVTFNWENVPVPVVVKAILGDLLGENYVIAPGVQGTVTFATAKPINASQALAVLEQALAWNNLALVYKDGRYTVLPTGQAIQGNLPPRIGSLRDQRGFEVRVAPLKYVAATEMEKLLAPYAKPGAIVRADNARSMLVLAGTATELETYLDTIDVFDVNWLKGMSVGMYPLERVEAKDIVPELEKIFGEGGPTPLAGMFRFLPIERMNAVMVITPQPEYLLEAERWLGRLDRGGSEAGAQLFVYYVKNVKATDLAEKLTEIFAEGSSRTSTTRSSSPIGAVAPGIESVEIKSINDKSREEPQQAAPRATAPSVTASGDGIAIVESDDIRITAIEDSNALLVRATPGQYDAILKAINRLDTVPLQVHIEAKILQVDLTGNLNFGVQWFFENSFSSGATEAYRRGRRGYDNETPGLARRNAWNSFAGTIGMPQGIRWTFLNTSAEALINALDSETNATVLAAPSLVVLNNKEASFNVGQQIPVVSSYLNQFQQTPTTPVDPNQPGTGFVNPGAGFSSVQFRDTGIILSVTPRVNPGGLVYLEISQENSSPAGAPDQTGNVAINKTEIETEIAVQSGETVLLGGLIKDQEQKGRDGIPGISKIPVLGRMFGSNTNTETRQEILILITPTVIENDQDARDLTNGYRQRFKGLQPLLKRVDEGDH